MPPPELPSRRRSALDDISHKFLEEKFGWKYETTDRKRLSGIGQRFTLGAKEDIVLESYPQAGFITLEFPDIEGFDSGYETVGGNIAMRVDRVIINGEAIGFIRNETNEQPEMFIVIGKSGEITMTRGKNRGYDKSRVPLNNHPDNFMQAAEAKPEISEI